MESLEVAVASFKIYVLSNISSLKDTVDTEVLVETF